MARDPGRKTKSTAKTYPENIAITGQLAMTLSMKVLSSMATPYRLTSGVKVEKSTSVPSI
jgi:hypothetical protein